MRKTKKVFGVLVFLMCALVIIPKSVNAAAKFDEYLTNGKLVINGVEPQDENEAYDRFAEHFHKLGVDDYQVAPASCDYTFTTCYLVYHSGSDDQEDKEIEIVYNYDKDVKKVVDNLIDTMGNKTTFKLTDMEIINYFLYGSEDSNLSSFSLDFRKALNYKNFELDVRGGDEHPFFKENIGIAEFIYNNTVYSYKDGFGVSAKQIIYIDNNATDIKEAIKKRITDTFGNVNIEVLDGSTVENFLESERNSAKEVYNQNLSYYQGQGYTSAEQYAEKYMNDNYYNDDATYHFLLSSSVLENYYILKINNKEYNFAVIKDSSKINNNLNYLTIDTKTNVEINTSSALPLDTLIKVAKLTSGEEYDKIVKILNTTNLDMFDLKLFSKSADNYITKLDDGTFEVKLPINEELKDKNLVVYYVTSEGKIEEYEVIVKDGYAIFKTNHFSIYSLAEKTSSIINESADEENPKTFDNVLLYITMGIISLIGLSGATIYLKRNNS